ncbi:hypothetical protein JX265_010945 [Neoarthrinium moseri]|uniref:Uncharacterized protein n=1 Tax=Neoarthrinium moseri TaxID=1658444 RepID=A0A9P9WCY0_9PEZI|nr:uncharacterized protein JN550_009690 [Neoarthrinium moseri]KAI1851711.1 hypothetical protein JX266_003173 [Neoarthrinium moseri]KAI1857915.1 hypothetical protein JX265_010945 [Neoarthrinium moseri]KAI1863370.1 hypothetical protein JN550_009690 [Neoarthrinium moseri]
MSTSTPEPPKAAQGTLSAWGNHSMPPAGLATLITALHFRPFQLRPMVFVPILFFASYINLQGFKKDAAGISAAASGTYALLALRRSPAAFLKRFSVRGVVRGTAIGLGAANALGGAWVYATADREKEKRERQDNPRWV